MDLDGNNSEVERVDQRDSKHEYKRPDYDGNSFCNCYSAIIQLFLNRRVAKLDLDRRKKEATISFTHEILELVTDLRQLIADEYSNEPIKYSEYESNEEMQRIITKYLNIMERISVGINTGVYDIDIYARICGRATIHNGEQLSHVIRKKRAERLVILAIPGQHSCNSRTRFL